MATILIVEDSMLLQKAMGDKFIKEGFDVLTADDGEEGLKLSLSRHPDVVLLDMELPKLDGIMVLEKLRQDAWGKSVPVLILSNSKNNDRIDRAEQLGAMAYMTKTDWELSGIVEMARLAANGEGIHLTKL